MVYLAITADGLRDVMMLAEKIEAAVWCGADAISQDGFDHPEYRTISRFGYPLAGAGEETMADALATIREHHYSPDKLSFTG